MLQANAIIILDEGDGIAQSNDIELPEELINEYKKLNDTIEQTIVKIRNKRKKPSLKK